MLSFMYRFRRQFDARRPSRGFGPGYLSLFLLSVGAAATNLWVPFLNWLLHIVRLSQARDFIGLCFLVAMVATLLLILGPAIYLNNWLRRSSAFPAPGPRAISR